jgi:hypothetical protein
MQRVFNGNSNFKQQLHNKFNHQSVSMGTPLYKACQQLYGKRFTDCPDFVCEICMITKVHRLPHPRIRPADRQKRIGDGAHGEFFIDNYSMPYPGEKGERTVCVMTDQKRIIAFAVKTRDLVPQGIMEVLEMMAKEEAPANSASHFLTYHTKPSARTKHRQTTVGSPTCVPTAPPN